MKIEIKYANREVEIFDINGFHIAKNPLKDFFELAIDKRNINDPFNGLIDLRESSGIEWIKIKD